MSDSKSAQIETCIDSHERESFGQFRFQYLMEDLKNNRAVWKDAEQTALDELRIATGTGMRRPMRTPQSEYRSSSGTDHP